MQSIWRIPLWGWVLCSAGLAWATTYSSITIDGDLTDFAADETLPADALDDSTYGSNNELTALYVTWDADALYLGLPYKAENTAVMLLLSTGKAGGVTDLCYGGAFSANLQGPDFDLLLAFFAPSDHGEAPAPYVYSLAAGSSVDISTATGVQIQLAETVSALGREGALEAAIPWDVIYGLGAGVIPPGATLRLAAVIRGALDQDNLGDVSPNPLGGLHSEKCGQGAGTMIDQLHQVFIDLDGNGTPDPGRSPNESPDAGPPADATPAPDQGRVPDSSPIPDQGRVPDSYPTLDTGKKPDAVPTDMAYLGDRGASEDQSMVPDSTNPRDLGAMDAGPGDSASSADGAKKIQQEEGCDCSTGVGHTRSLMVCWLLVGMMILRRFRRRNPR